MLYISDTSTNPYFNLAEEEFLLKNMQEDIFRHPLHPYTKSLLSAIPYPNPEVEKRRHSLSYNYASSGIDYSKGTDHRVEGTHTVLATEAEFAKWCK